MSGRQAIILAGGRGTRLAPYTTVFPKPLMPVGSMPILEVIVRQLVAAGFDRFEIATGHLSALIEAFFGDGTRWNCAIRYHREDAPLGTAGPLKALEAVLDASFLIMNGDTLTDLDFAGFLAAHDAGPCVLTAATCQRNFTLSLGAIVRGADGAVADYIEKPTYSFECSAGIYAARRTLLEHIQPDVALDLPTLVRRLIAANVPVAAQPIPGFWLDIGTPDDYARATDAMIERFPHFLAAE